MSSSKSLLRPLSKSVYYLAAPSPSRSSTNPVAAAASSRQSSSATTPAVDDDPSLLVVFGWMDAQIKHVEKYLTSYRKLFPTSPILLLQSSQKGFYSKENMEMTRKAFAPAIEIIRQQQQSDQKKKKMLLHVFSNGGCMSLKWLNQELISRGRGRSWEESEKTRFLSSLPLDGTRAIIFDSCPGKSSLLVTMRAFSAPIRSRILKLPTMGLLAILHGFISLYNFILRKPPILNRLFDYLNLPNNLPPVSRLYIYSKIDELIPYKDVEEHARQAKEELGIRGGGEGGEVRLERFESTSHVGHMRGDPERYWNSIQKVWRDSK